MCGQIGLWNCDWLLTVILTILFWLGNRILALTFLELPAKMWYIAIDRSFQAFRCPNPYILVFETLKMKTYTDLEQALKEPDKVQILDLSNQGLTEIPVEIFQLTNLTRLGSTRGKFAFSSIWSTRPGSKCFWLG